MNARYLHPKTLWFLLPLAVLAVGLAMISEQNRSGDAFGISWPIKFSKTLSVNDNKVSLQGLGKVIRVSLPISGSGGGQAKISVSLLDPSDNAQAKGSSSFQWSGGSTNATIDLPISLDKVDAATARIGYDVAFAGEKVSGIVAVSKLLGKLELSVLGQTEYLAGSKGGLRVIAWDRSTGSGVKNATVRIALDDGTLLYAGKTNELGTAETSFKIPEDKEGGKKVTITVTSAVGEQKVEQSITIKKTHKILVTTDKPIYQPGQIMHIRALALKQADKKPLAKSDLVIEVEDGKGNKVYKKTYKTNDFGIIGCDFEVADEVNMGRYVIRALIGSESQEKTVTVQRYVLPKFKLAFTTDKQYYMPGEKVKGEVQADYFFGKPVANGDVEVILSTFDAGFHAFQTIHAKTDAKGHATFDAELPKFFAGLPLEQGNAFVKFEIAVTDKADHQERKEETRSVAKDPVLVKVVPEGRGQKVGLENFVNVIATYPDGSPAECVVVLQDSHSKSTFTERTDKFGIARFKVTGKKEYVTLTAKATDKQGNTGTATASLSPAQGEAFIALRPALSLYKVGETAHLTVVATKQTGTVYLDVIKDNQTILTKAVDLKQGRGSMALDLGPDLTGALWLHAYLVSHGADICRDTRVIYVNPANDLNIAVMPTKDTYLPAEDAEIAFQVKDLAGHPVYAALGIQVVDEAVFALSENQPGMEKIYFNLEKELLEPKIEIHGFGPLEVVSWEEKKGLDDAKQHAAEILFNQATRMVDYALNVDTYGEERSKMLTAFSPKFSTSWNAVSQALQRYRRVTKGFPKPEDGLSPLMRKGYLKSKDLLDPWGTPYKVKDLSGEWSFTLMSAGPDKDFDSADDVPYQGYGWWGWDDEAAFGGRGGLRRDMRMKAARQMAADGMALPMAAAPAGSMKAMPMEEAKTETRSGEKDGGGAEPRIREYFPETLFSEPSLITDASGRAKVKIKMADSITKWRLLAMASSLAGQMGSTTAGITVFQDFFVDIDLPVSLTKGDEVSIPVAMYNYLSGPQKVRLELQKDTWFDLSDAWTKEKEMARNEVGVLYYTFTAKEIGKHKLTVKAYGSKMSDAISREIEVVPDGEEQMASFSDRLEGKVTKTITIPKGSIDGTEQVFVKVFPGILSQVVGGLESMLRMPSGCFEQTSSMTYPNILILDYLKRTRLAKPEIQMTAEQYIALGYQRLVSFEVPGGGFDWFGNPPANKVLTAYGLMEFHDMSKVHEVDPGVISRTQNWLANQQEKDGSWTPDKAFLHNESWGRIQNSSLLPTAYLSWALTESGYKGDAAKRGIEYIKAHLGEAKDPYTLALVVNALVAYDKEAESTRQAIEKLLAMAQRDKDAVYWKSEIPSVTFSGGESANLETTALAGYALVRSGRYMDVAGKVITYLVRNKDSFGSWYSTQATVMSLKTLVAALEKSTEDVDASIAIEMNGKLIKTLKLNKQNSDVMQMLDLRPYTVKGENAVSLSLTGKGSAMYEVVTRYYLRWDDPVIQARAQKPEFDLGVNYDRTELLTNEVMVCKVRAKNNQPAVANMVILDVGLPPGFEVVTADLDAQVGKKIQKYGVTPRQVILYLDKLDPRAPFELAFGMRAKFPLRAKTRLSKAYEYYNPGNDGQAQPVLVKVTK